MKKFTSHLIITGLTVVLSSSNAFAAGAAGGATTGTTTGTATSTTNSNVNSSTSNQQSTFSSPGTTNNPTTGINRTRP